MIPLDKQISWAFNIHFLTSSNVSEGIILFTNLCALSTKIPVNLPSSVKISPPSGLGESGLIPACSSAFLLTHKACASTLAIITGIFGNFKLNFSLFGKVFTFQSSWFHPLPNIIFKDLFRS